ncbi:unnamed protein product [Phytomonas sp. Hart1]|nr:unnamed protein product [Phytomonas sp. Hart1]|eukprot:CCW71693.1 unnamed protein product [Phytomonas sp. isolate Hart1]
MRHPRLPLVLRKDDHLVVAVYDEDGAALTELTGDSANVYTGDYRECEVCLNPARPGMFAHATTTHLRCSQIEISHAEGEADGGFTTRCLFEQAMPHVVIEMAFSPRGKYLVTYAMMDPKRTPDGNLSIFDLAAGGALVVRSAQTRWPAVAWTATEEFLVRPMQGWLHVLAGHPTREESAPSAPEENGRAGGGFPCLSKIDLMLAQDKEFTFSTSTRADLPLLALFKPFYKNQQASLLLYRLPNLQEGPLYQVPFGRSEAARVLWSHSGHHLALLAQSERDARAKSYYETISLHLIDVLKRRTTSIRLTEEGETVHDARWSPTPQDELLVVHGKMPRNQTTLFGPTGAKLLSLGEAPRNRGLWAPNAAGFVLGGSGNLAGDYVFYAYAAGKGEARRPPRGESPAAPSLPVSTGAFNEKCSLQEWAPDSHHFLCATLFTRLRMDNKVVIFKKNGARVVTVRYPALYGAHWVGLRSPGDFPLRAPSPRAGEGEGEQKPRAYCPPGGTSTRAAALLRRQDPAVPSSTTASAGPVGAVLVQKRKKKR